jgi:hypothetical protein
MEPRPSDEFAALLAFPAYIRLQQALFPEVPVDESTVLASPEEDPWKAMAKHLGEEATAATTAQAEADAVYARVEAAARAEAEQRAEQDRKRIDGFLARMDAAGNPGCGNYDLCIAPTPYEAGRGYNGTTMRGEDPYDLVVRGWAIESNATTFENRSSWHDPPSHTTFEKTVLTVDGIAYYVKYASNAPNYERRRVNPEDITLEMLVRTLIQNGVTV